MTKFEVERMEAAFKYLEVKMIDRYSEALKSDDPERVKKVQNLIERQSCAYDEVKKALQAFGVFEESDAGIAEKAFNDPDDADHIFAFSASCKSFANEEYRQVGANAEDAERHLRSRLAFEHCTSMKPEDFEIKLLCQMC